MIIKKFQADTESEAIIKAKEEMGSGAVVLNIKTVKHRGISRLFKKNYVEVTAALEENQAYSQSVTGVPKSINVAVGESYKANSRQAMEPGTSAIEEKLNSLQSMLEQRMKAEKAADGEDDEKKENAKEPEKENREQSLSMKFMKLIYNQLIDNEVDEKYVNQIIGEIQTALKKESTVDSILAAVYQKIILKVGQPKAIEYEEGKTKVVFFVGPTGVGKTTTIAKLASYFKLEKKLKVAMITSDTFRIAAVEQLRTYAAILDVPVQVIFTIEELNQAVEDFSDYDLIFVDTAGRSHKNNEQCSELLHLIRDSKIGENMEKEIYLVLSAATKYKDLQKIHDSFKKIKGYSIIFTKLDETVCLGNILNMKLSTGVDLSYVTSGQVVPDDISILDPQFIARSLLGSNK